MKRLVLPLAATMSVLALAPAVALGHHHHSGARKHHSRIMRFGDLSGQPSTTSPTSNAGTVVSFTGGVLTIQVGSSTVSGTVTNDTEIECATSGEDQSGEDQGDDDQGTTGTSQTTSDDDQSTSGTDESTGDDDQSTSGTDQSTGEDDQGSGEDDQGSSGSCSSSNLTPGTPISAAELRISSAGNAWEKVELGS